MTRTLPALCLSASLAFGGCAANGGLDVSGASAFIAQVQQAAVAACGFLPTAETVAQIAAAASLSASAGVALGKTIASTICAGVTAAAPAPASTAKSLRAHSAPRVYGVAIRGRFVR